MLHISKQLRSQTHLLTQLFKTFSSSSYQILDIKNSHLVLIKDPNNKLPYMKQIQTQQGNKGIVLKLEEQSRAVIGFYHALPKITQSLVISDISKDKPKNINLDLNRVYDINNEEILKASNANQKNKNYILQKNILEKQGQVRKRKNRLASLSPIFSACYNLYRGDFVNFSGSLGSGRTHTALQAMSIFTNSVDQSVGIYLNTNNNDQKECKIAAQTFNSMSFGRRSNHALTSVGVYMLCLKTIAMAKTMKQSGKNVFLIVDNLNEIMANQWTILQSLKLSIAPVSILNQLYSISGENTLADKNKGKTGSITTISISNSSDQDITQEYTNLSNNTKHLKTLGKHIQFPLKLTKNHSKITDSEHSQNLRNHINRYIQQKNKSQLQWKLKLNKDEPWQHYYLYDAQWWVPALRKYRPVSFGDRDLFMWWININVDGEHCAHWKIQCLDAYKKYKEFLAQPENLSVGMDEYQLENFIELAKHEEYYDVFKKDYL